jgi:hypothetical protein
MLRRNMRHSVVRRYLRRARGKSQIARRDGGGLEDDSKIRGASFNSFHRAKEQRAFPSNAKRGAEAPR